MGEGDMETMHADCPIEIRAAVLEIGEEGYAVTA
jgi:hypothetical protein